MDKKIIKGIVAGLVWLAFLLCGSVCKAESDVTVFAFFSNQSEREVVDSIAHCYGAAASGRAVKAVPVVIEDGKINEMAQKFSSIVDSVCGRDASIGYSMVGVGILGSAAATICASEADPQSLALVSGVGVDGKDLLYRVSSSFSFIVDIPYAMADSLRREIRAGLDGVKPLFMVPEEFRQLVAYRPAQYLQKVKCPVYAAFGTSDCVVEWYANSVGLEANLNGSRNNCIRVYSGLGYCLRETSNPTNIAMFGDKRPDVKEHISSAAIADIVNWLINASE